MTCVEVCVSVHTDNRPPPPAPWGAEDWRPVQTCSLEDPLLLPTSGGYGWRAFYWNDFLLKIVLTHDVNDAAVHAGFGQEGERAVVFIIRSRIHAPDVLVNSAIVTDIVWNLFSVVYVCLFKGRSSLVTTTQTCSNLFTCGSPPPPPVQSYSLEDPLGPIQTCSLGNTPSV